MSECYRVNINVWPIVLEQDGPNDFTVRYGQQVRDGLHYTAAARELGAAIMHALACEDRLDNRMPGEVEAADGGSET